MTFSDYIMPNTALEEGDLDANIYQTIPFLDQYNEDHGTDFVPVRSSFPQSDGDFFREIREYR